MKALPPTQITKSSSINSNRDKDRKDHNNEENHHKDRPQWMSEFWVYFIFGFLLIILLINFLIQMRGERRNDWPAKETGSEEKTG